MQTPITFKDFSSEENYLTLQNKFSILDERANPYESVVHDKIKLGDYKIIIKEVNSVTYEEEYEDKYFYKDFLYDGIASLATRYLSHLKEFFEQPIFLDTEKIQLYADRERAKLDQLSSNIKATKYLENDISDRLEVQIDIVVSHLVNVHIHPNWDLDKKLKFKLNRDTVLLIFALLRDKKYIDSPYDSDLGRIIDANFLWWDSKAEIYKPFKRSGKVINDLKNKNRPCVKPLKKLKSIFFDKYFYSFPNS